MQYDHKFKLMMLGDAGVGKTSIARWVQTPEGIFSLYRNLTFAFRRFTEDAFLNTYIHTIGIDFLERMVEIDCKNIMLQVWDTAGQDR